MEFKLWELVVFAFGWLAAGIMIGERIWHRRREGMNSLYCTADTIGTETGGAK